VQVRHFPLSLFDSFSSHPFGGSIAAVVDNAGDLQDEEMMQIAREVGAPEAAATGTTNRALACYLVRHGLATADSHGDCVVRVEQGYELNRPSRIRTTLRIQDGAPIDIRVGGVATCTLTGAFHLP
jgi:predicted PhzF superfamily epimerase YddE/YHI9